MGVGCCSRGVVGCGGVQRRGLLGSEVECAVVAAAGLRERGGVGSDGRWDVGWRVEWGWASAVENR